MSVLNVPSQITGLCGGDITVLTAELATRDVELIVGCEELLLLPFWVLSSMSTSFSIGFRTLSFRVWDGI